MNINAVRRTMRSICGHGGANRCAGEVRASAPIRVLVAVIAALLAVQFMPVAAYADSINAQIISGPSAVPFADMYGASIAAPDRYTAAAVLLGHSPEDISSWGDDIRAKLSNEQTGGQFYNFSENSVQNYFDATEHTGIFKTFLDYVGGMFWNIAQSLYGNNLWAALYTSNEYAAAASDLSAILAGENIGGGSGGSGGTSASFPINLQLEPGEWSKGLGEYQQYYFNTTNGKVYTSAIDSISVALTKEDSYNLPAGDFDIYVVASETNAYSFGNVYVILIPKGLGEIKVVNGKTGLYLKEYTTYYLRQFTPPASAGVLNNRVVSVSFSVYGFGSDSQNAGYRVVGEGSDTRAYYFNSASSEPVVPPSNWPDEPSAPLPPELPEPGTNPTVTPTPWAPVISPTFDFDLNVTTEPTSNDLIDWVKKIYFELRSFHSDEKDWFDEIGNGIDALVDAIDDAQEQIYGELQTIDETLRSEGQKIRDYMYRMFHWLKDQLNFQNDSFNDSNIVYWLKRIWSKLGNGDINLRPTDPTNDPDDWWDWLVKAIQNFLIGLAATSTELISEIADLASQVMHEFPFSIPWDIAAVLAALSTAPVTPVFTITVPAISGWWNTFDFVIDLSPFNGAAETIRLMEKLLFTGLLIWKSKELLDFMDVTKWFN